MTRFREEEIEMRRVSVSWVPRCAGNCTRRIWFALVFGLTYGLLGGDASAGATFGEVQAFVFICNDAAQAGQTDFTVGRAKLSFTRAGAFTGESGQTQDCRLAGENEAALTLTSVDGANVFEGQTDAVGFVSFGADSPIGDYTLAEDRNGVTSDPFAVGTDVYQLVAVVIYEADAAVGGVTQANVAAGGLAKAYSLPSAGVGDMATDASPWTPVALAAFGTVFAIAALRFHAAQPAVAWRTRNREHGS
jgi:hypothetical protein